MTIAQILTARDALRATFRARMDAARQADGRFSCPETVALGIEEVAALAAFDREHPAHGAVKAREDRDNAQLVDRGFTADEPDAYDR